MTTLALFDIDGTMLWTDGAGRRAIHQALIEVFGTTGPADYWFDGKTDRQIVRDLMRLEGHGDHLIDARIDDLFDRYLRYLERELTDRSHVPHLYPGVLELLDALEARGDVMLGLLTGNLQRGAEVKLESVGIDPGRFRIGAFGSDHEERPRLPEIARRRAVAMLGRDLPGERVVVIGDTPADIACGRSIGARAVAVATGRYNAATLRTHSPSAVFEDLTDTDAVVHAIVGGEKATANHG